MQNFLNLIENFNTYSVILRLVLSVVIGGLIGYERGRHGSAAGLRTHVLVCLGAALTSLTSFYVWNLWPTSGDIFRISAQVISGIGFLGAGMIIIKNKNIVTGLTTAAGVWSTAAIGIALGYGFYAGSLTAAVICIFTTYVLKIFERRRKTSANIYAEITADSFAANTVDKIKELIENSDYTINITTPKSGLSGSLGIYINISGKIDVELIKAKINDISGVNFLLFE